MFADVGVWKMFVAIKSSNSPTEMNTVSGKLSLPARLPPALRLDPGQCFALNSNQLLNPFCCQSQQLVHLFPCERLAFRRPLDFNEAAITGADYIHIHFGA